MVLGHQVKSANLGIRVLSAILDSLVVSLIWYFTIETWGHVGQIADQASVVAGGDKTLTGFPALLVMAITAAFWILPEWLMGATLGKLIFGLRVTRLEGGRISFGQSLKRNVLRLIDFFPFYLTGFLVAALTPKRQRLGDLWARTIVVRKRDL